MAALVGRQRPAAVTIGQQVKADMRLAGQARTITGPDHCLLAKELLADRGLRRSVVVTRLPNLPRSGFGL
jgi:hypothetical protein